MKTKYFGVVLIMIFILLSPLISNYITILRDWMSLPLANTFNDEFVENKEWVIKLVYYEGLVGIGLGIIAVLELLGSKGESNFLMRLFFGYLIIDSIQGAVGYFSYSILFSDADNFIAKAIREIFIYRGIFDCIWILCSYFAIRIIEKYNDSLQSSVQL